MNEEREQLDKAARDYVADSSDEHRTALIEAVLNLPFSDPAFAVAYGESSWIISPGAVSQEGAMR